MKQQLIKVASYLGSLAFLAALLTASGLHAADSPARPSLWTDGCSENDAALRPGATVEKVQVLCIWADKKGISHFKDIEIPLPALRNDASVFQSDPTRVKRLWFTRSSGQFNMDWHQAPRRQILIPYIGGAVEVTAGDGEKRLIKVGTIVLVADVWGQGHKSRAFEGLPANTVVIELDQ